MKLIRFKANYVIVYAFVASLLFGFLSNIYIAFTTAQSVLAGMMLFLSINFLKIFFQSRSTLDKLDKIEENLRFDNKMSEMRYLDQELHSQVNELIDLSVDAIKSLEKDDLSIYRDNLYGVFEECRLRLKDIRSNFIYIPAMEVRSSWLKVIASTKSSYYTTNFENDMSFGRALDPGFEEAQNDLASRIKSDFIRIFVYKDDDELDALSGIVKSQREIGIRVDCSQGRKPGS